MTTSNRNLLKTKQVPQCFTIWTSECGLNHETEPSTVCKIAVSQKRVPSCWTATTFVSLFVYNKVLGQMECSCLIAKQQLSYHYIDKCSWSAYAWYRPQCYHRLIWGMSFCPHVFCFNMFKKENSKLPELMDLLIKGL